MNKKLVNEFSKKLKALDSNLKFEILKNNQAVHNKGFVSSIKKGAVLVSYQDTAILTLDTVFREPSILVESPIMIGKDASPMFGNLIKLCGEYLDAFFGGDEHDN